MQLSEAVFVVFVVCWELGGTENGRSLSHRQRVFSLCLTVTQFMDYFYIILS